MFAKLFFICAVAAVALGLEYPPGIHPAICPNYPYCDPEVLARHTPQGMPIPDWELPYARMVAAPFVYAQMHHRAWRHAPAKFPADVDPSSCPYPYC